MQDGRFDPLSALGGSLLQDHGIGLANGVDFVAETVPAQANVTAHRRTTALFGLGLVDALTDGTLRDLARIERLLDPAAAGVVAMVPDILHARLSAGKFGCVARSLPNAAASEVKRSPVSCMPSPESPAKRMTTR